MRWTSCGARWLRRAWRRPRRRGLAHRGAGAPPLRRGGRRGARRARGGDRLLPRALGDRPRERRRRGRCASIRMPARTAGRRRSPPTPTAAPPTSRPSAPTSRAAGVADRVRHVRAFSGAALAEVPGPSTCCSSTAPTASAPARADVVGWGDRVRARRAHARARRVVVGRRHARAADDDRVRAAGGATGPRRVAGAVRARGRGARAGNAARQLRELPWFARNLVVKALIVARLLRGPWPY